jgi:hypothetical protein
MVEHDATHRRLGVVSMAAALWGASCGGAPSDPAATPPVTVAVPETGSSAPGEPASPADEGRFRCTVEVPALGPVRTGEATGDSAAGLAEEAKRDVCKQLWEAEKVDCDDESRVSVVSRQTNLTVINGVTTHTARLLLRSVGETYRGKGSADASGTEACMRAVDRACSQAPSGAECSGRGLYCKAVDDDPTELRCTTKPPAQPQQRLPSGMRA